jgi:hypothetical protein
MPVNYTERGVDSSNRSRRCESALIRPWQKGAPTALGGDRALE